MAAVDFARLGLIVDETARVALRGGRSVKLTATQAMILAWLGGAATPCLACCCDELWERVDPGWVRGQIERLGWVLEPLELTLALGPTDLIHLTADEGPGVSAPAEISAPSDEAAEISGEPPFTGFVEPNRIVEATTDGLRIARDELAARAGRIAELERQLEIVTASLKDSEVEVARLREAAKGQLVVVNQAREEIAARERAEAELGHVRAALATANDRNAELSARLEERLKVRLVAEREGARKKAASKPPRQKTARDAALARNEGVLLATQAGLVEHRDTEPAPTRIVELHLSDADFARLIAAARADGQTPAACARTLMLGALALREA